MHDKISLLKLKFMIAVLSIQLLAEFDHKQLNNQLNKNATV